MQSELDKAIPALAAAEEALNVLTKKDFAELKAYAKPPTLVEVTLCGEHSFGDDESKRAGLLIHGTFSTMPRLLCQHSHAEGGVFPLPDSPRRDDGDEEAPHVG